MPTLAKNIKDAIAETEKNKNNLTQAKTKIDNKIQNLGGQKPTNIFDVANKIEGMVNTQYKKIAMGSVSEDLVERVNTNTGAYNQKTIKLNINFIPTRIILTNIRYVGFKTQTGTNYGVDSSHQYFAYIDSNYISSNVKSMVYIDGQNEDNQSKCRLKSKDLKNKSVTVEFQVTNYITKISYDWIAIG